MKTTKYSIPNTNKTTQNTKHTKYQKHELGLGPELQTVSFPSQRMNEPKDKLNDAAWIKVLDLKKVKLLGYFNPPLREGPPKKRFYLGLSPKQRTPPTHPYGLGLPKLKSKKFHEISWKNYLLRMV